MLCNSFGIQVTPRLVVNLVRGYEWLAAVRSLQAHAFPSPASIAFSRNQIRFSVTFLPSVMRLSVTVWMMQLGFASCRPCVVHAPSLLPELQGLLPALFSQVDKVRAARTHDRRQ